MNLSQLRKLIREVIRETVIDKDRLDRVATSLPQTKEKKIKKELTVTEVGNSIIESTPSDIIKDLDKIKNDLLKKVSSLVDKKKKLYSNVDITTPMSPEEKKLDKEISDIFSQINKLVAQKRTLKTEIKSFSLKEYRKGEIFGGKIKIDGGLVQVEVELLGADNKRKTFITKIINVDKQWWSKLPKDGILEIPARVFRAPGGGWYKIKTPNIF
jgi:chaperonin cofactor prefoldin